MQIYRCLGSQWQSLTVKMGKEGWRYSFIDTWVMHLVLRKVGSDDRKEIWKGLRELWDIPKNDVVEKKTMVYAACAEIRWRVSLLIW
ncbi:hypothetical protein P8452_16776 [Trifolium repens]|nr:hypothetical protein P8452_16776 [Trifolium repens]